MDTQVSCTLFDNSLCRVAQNVIMMSKSKILSRKIDSKFDNGNNYLGLSNEERSLERPLKGQ